MSFATCGGAPVLRAHVDMPRVGAWCARLVLDAEKPPAGPVTLEADGVTLAGFVHVAGIYQGTTFAHVVGGRSGRLGQVVSPKYYREVPVRIPVVDVLTEAGETLSPRSSTDAHLPKWVRRRSSAGAALESLAEEVGAVWRVLDDGTVWIGTDSWTPATAPYDLLEVRMDVGEATISEERLTLRPGTTLEGQHVQHVAIAIEPDSVRTRVVFEA